MPIIDWYLVGVLIVLFLVLTSFFCALLITWRAFKSFRIDQWLFKRKCKHKYKIVEYCENCGNIIEVRFLEGEENEV